MISKGERLPGPFLRFWAADTLTSAGDGFTLVAAPLLLVTLTSSPILIAGGVFAAQIPWRFLRPPVIHRQGARR